MCTVTTFYRWGKEARRSCCLDQGPMAIKLQSQVVYTLVGDQCCPWAGLFWSCSCGTHPTTCTGAPIGYPFPEGPLETTQQTNKITTLQCSTRRTSRKGGGNPFAVPLSSSLHTCTSQSGILCVGPPWKSSSVALPVEPPKSAHRTALRVTTHPVSLDWRGSLGRET